ncbi:MAG TPA: TIM barrel protein [Verrucomicrobiae bacterium]|nr:TIM barrel protein [Verrucomicrobiae bacterium]
MKTTRRSAFKTASILVAGAALGSRLQAADAVTKGRVNHSVCKWCYPKNSIEELCTAGKEFGLQSVELLQPSDFPILKKHKMTCAMVSSPNVDGLGGIDRSWNRIEHHDKLVGAYEARIKEVADEGMVNLICFSGNRKGLDDEKGIENCAIGLKRIMATAEKYKVNICMELLNSKVNHKDYQCDHTPWGVEVCKRVGSERMKLLYDIYHMQIMEGDMIATIKKYKDYLAHYHTGGVPGRNEIDETQEINYPAVMRAIIDTGYKGFVAQEFLPKREPLTSLRQAVGICDV